MDEIVNQKLEFDKIRELLIDKAYSAGAKKALSELMPSDNREEVEKLLQETSEAEHVILTATSFPVTAFDSVNEELSRLRARASLSCAELLRVNNVHKAAKRAKQVLTAEDEAVVSLREIAEGLYYDNELIKTIDNAILSDEEIADTASPELRDIRRKIKNANASIRDRLNQIIHSKEKSQYLQEAIITQREGRFVVPVRQEYRSQIPGLIHGQSSSGATLFVEPMNVVEANNELRLLEEEERREIIRILRDISLMASESVRELQEDIDILIRLDIIFAKANLAISMKAFRPVISDGRKIRILQGRHPLIDRDKVIPVTVEVEEEINTLIITGPNTGGKTVTLKLIGLFALMCQSGMFIPAMEGSELPIFSGVYADIGDEQSIEQSLSTFSSHMKNIIFILRKADENSLVLIDELGAGTDPEEGTALALAILNELTNRGAHIFATTHYGEIKAYAMKNDRFENASMEFDPESLKPTFRLVMGIAGASNAFLISKRLGLKDYIIDSARSFMSEERVRYDELVLEAERSRKAADRKMTMLSSREQELRETEQRIKKMENEASKKREEYLLKAREDALKIIKDAKDETERILKEARKTRRENESDATRTTERIRGDLKERTDILERQIGASKDDERRNKKLDPASIYVGQEVHVISFNVDGIVQSRPDQKGNVTVQAGIMTIEINVSDLEEKKVAAKKYERTSSVSLNRKMTSLSVNITGKTVDEGIMEVDKYLDDAFLSGLKEVTIIHGKGTGALRKGVQDYLRRHKHVKSFRNGNFGEGAEGVTVVTLK